MVKKREVHPWWDAFAVGASVLCLFHCLALPLILALAPAASSALGLPPWFHLAAFAVAVPASAVALRRGYLHHGMSLPVLLGTVGLILLGLGALCGFQILVETGLTIFGSVLLAAGHLRNWKLQRSSGDESAGSIEASNAAACRCR